MFALNVAFDRKSVKLKKFSKIFVFFVNVVKQIERFADIKTSLHFWDKNYLIIVFLMHRWIQLAILFKIVIFLLENKMGHVSLENFRENFFIIFNSLMVIIFYFSWASFEVLYFSKIN